MAFAWASYGASDLPIFKPGSLASSAVSKIRFDLCPAKTVRWKTAIRFRLGQEMSCQGEYGINKEACNAKGGAADRMYGFFGGTRPEQT